MERGLCPGSARKKTQPKGTWIQVMAAYSGPTPKKVEPERVEMPAPVRPSPLLEQLTLF